MERWTRVLLWGALTLIFVLPAIAQGIVRDPSHYVSFIFAAVGMFVVLWLSWLAGRSVVDAVWLDGDHLFVRSGRTSLRINLRDIVAIDVPARMSFRIYGVDVILRKRGPLGRQIYFIAASKVEFDAVFAWFEKQR